MDARIFQVAQPVWATLQGIPNARAVDEVMRPVDISILVALRG